MKRQSREMLDRQRRLSRYEIVKRRKITRSELRSLRVRLTKSRIRRATVIAPAEIQFHGTETTRTTYWRFIHDIDHRLRSGYLVKIDLRAVKLLLPCGVLMLLSHVRGWVSLYQGKLTGTYPEDEVVEQMLQSVGILTKLGLESRATINREEVTRWYHFHGEDVDAAQISPFMDVARERLGEANQSLLYDSIVEAITNVRQHAYEEDRRTRWWMFASLSAQTIFVSIFDEGRSIPATLMDKPGVTLQVKSWGWGRGPKADARIIHAAMGGQSRTQLKYRGKGLPEMLESTKKTAGSNLSIYSRQGVFYCDSSTGRESRGTLSYPVDGTLLLWLLKTSEQTS